MLVAIKKDFCGGFFKAVSDVIGDFKDPKWRWKTLPEYLINHPEFEISQDYHEGRYFKVGDNYIMLIDVDISRPWTVEEYDGSEYIQYLDYNVIDMDSNYCEFKR